MSARFAVRVHPGAPRTELRGFMNDGVLKLAVTGAPESGRANRAVVALLAGALGVPARQVVVGSGAGSRRKWIDVQGLDRAEVRRRLERALAAKGRRTDAE